MGIYGHKFDALIESRKPVTETVSISEQTFGITSVVYDEYMNRCSLLESCLDDNNKTILEAQIEVLREVSIKDIMSTIRQKIKDVFDKIKKFFIDIFEKIQKIFSKKQVEEIEEIVDNIDEKDLKEEEIRLICIDNKIEDKLIKTKNIVRLLPLYTDLKGNGSNNFNIQYKNANPEKIDKEVEEFFKITVDQEYVEDFCKRIKSREYNKTDTIFVNSKQTVDNFLDRHSKIRDTISEIQDSIESRRISLNKYLDYWLKRVEEDRKSDEEQGIDQPNQSMAYTVNYINKDLRNIERLAKIYHDLFYTFVSIIVRDKAALSKLSGSNKSEESNNEPDKISKEED